MKQFVTIIFAFTFIQSNIFAEITAEVSITGTSVNGYLNVSNTITVTVTATGGDITDYNTTGSNPRGVVFFWVSFGSEDGEAA
ncbi:MAG: hypothetical protein VX260_06300, partial [Candidatus Neomarinimicrobiota bacterium]|nr:hypothetical protein [Candidatus Neomarinimicrobiota bacterium]